MNQSGIALAAAGAGPLPPRRSSGLWNVIRQGFTSIRVDKKGESSCNDGEIKPPPAGVSPVSILSPGPAANTPDPRFYSLPWHDDHPNKRDIERRLEPGHCARLIDEAVRHLDLSAL